MKNIKILAILAFLTLTLSLKGQSYLSFGYTKSYYSMSNLNRYVFMYNYNRQWLDQKMDFFTNSSGFQMAYGYRFSPRFYFESELLFPHRMNSAWGVEPNSGSKATRTIKFGVSSINLNYYLNFINTGFFNVGFGCGPGISFANIKTTYLNDATKNYEEDITNDKIFLDFSFGVPLELNFGDRLALVAKPYIDIPFKKTDVGELQLFLQQITEEAYDKALTYGVTFSVKIIGGH